MIYYEMLMILTSDIPQTIYDEINNTIYNIIKQKDGIVVTYDKWGKYLLAYKIKKSTYGIYVLVRFGIAKEKVQEVLQILHNTCNLKYNNYIMRYVFVKIGKTISDIYCRPDSLEDAPRREKTYDIDEVIARKNKTPRKTKNFNGAYFSNIKEDDNNTSLKTTLNNGNETLTIKNADNIEINI